MILRIVIQHFELLQLLLSLTLEQKHNVSRIANVRDDYNCKHEHRVEGIQENLMSEQAPSITLDVLNNPEDRSHQDQNQCRVESNR